MDSLKQGKVGIAIDANDVRGLLVEQTLSDPSEFLQIRPVYVFKDPRFDIQTRREEGEEKVNS